MREEDIYEILRRWRAGQGISRIAKTQNRDRKTVRCYIEKLEEGGLGKAAASEREALYALISQMVPQNGRPSSAYRELEGLEEEFRELINDRREPVRPKTAFEILKQKRGLSCSYSTFKRFARATGLYKKRKETCIRIELPPGLETQIDYGKVGLLEDRGAGRRRVVSAFVGGLSHSRLPFIQYVYKQDQGSFVGSIIDMFEFYGGATEILSMDNLKSGVVSPDLYDPKLNRTCAEMADYYGVFIDPCRVGTPRDNAKVERRIPMARELFRKLKKLHPTADIIELNRRALEWCREEYGRRAHGTTGLAPLLVFESIEKGALKQLPEERFEIAQWKRVIVHPDQYIQFEKKTYSVPAQYRGEELWVRKSGNMICIFQNHQLIREYVIPRGHRAYEPGDFPEVVREMINGGYPKYLLKQAERFGREAYELIKQVLTPGAYLNARRAQGILRVMEHFRGKEYFSSVCEKAKRYRVNIPKVFQKMMEDEEHRMELHRKGVEVSETGKQMTRDIHYYLGKGVSV